MPSAQSTIEVERPVSTAYNQWTQFETFPEFMTGVEDVTQLDDRRTHWSMTVAGVEREFDAEITDQVPDQHIAWESVGDIRQGGSVTFESLTPETTRVTLQMSWEPDSTSERLGAVLQIDDALVAGNLRRFKSYLESQGSEDGAWRGEIHEDQEVSPTQLP